MGPNFSPNIMFKGYVCYFTKIHKLILSNIKSHIKQLKLTYSFYFYQCINILKWLTAENASSWPPLFFKSKSDRDYWDKLEWRNRAISGTAALKILTQKYYKLLATHAIKNNEIYRNILLYYHTHYIILSQCFLPHQ